MKKKEVMIIILMIEVVRAGFLPLHQEIYKCEYLHCMVETISFGSVLTAFRGNN